MGKDVRWFNQRWVRVGLTLTLMALILVWVGPKSIWDTIKTSRPGPLLLSLLFTPVVIGVKTLRWLLLARTQCSISFREALRSYLAGLALAIITPMAAGEAGRGLFVSTGDPAGLTGKVILDKLVDLSTVSIFSGIGLFLTGEPAAQAIGVAISVGTFVAWSGMLLLRPKLEGLADGVEASGLARFFGGLRTRFRIPAIVSGLTRTPVAQLALNMGLSLVGFTVFYSQAFVLMRAFWAEAPWTVVPYFPIITLSTILPIAIGGVGVREWTAILLLRRFGVTESVAFNTFFAHFVIVQLLPAFAGAAIVGSFRREGE